MEIIEQIDKHKDKIKKHLHLLLYHGKKRQLCHQISKKKIEKAFNKSGCSSNYIRKLVFFSI